MRPLGVQFPSGNLKLGSVGSITYNADSVNIVGKTIYELTGTNDPNAEKRASKNSQLNVDTDNPIYRSGVEEADYGEALPDGYSEYDIVQEMLSDARGTMNDFKGNTKLKAELDEEVRQQIGERRTRTGERRTALSRASRRSEPNFRQNNKNGVFLPRKW